MYYQHSYEQALEYSRTSLDEMKRLNVPATPSNFSIFYEYASGRSPDLNKAIDILISNRQEFTPETLLSLYERFFGFDEESRQVRESTQRLQNQLGSLLTLVDGAGQDTREYGHSLQNFSDRVSANRSKEELTVLIADMLAETRMMEDKARKLEDQLSQATQEISNLRKNLSESEREALTDVLTGLANRKHFDRFISNAAKEAMEGGTPLSILMLDIDHFKKFNDTWGHQLGDQVLKIVGSVIRKSVAETDLAARYGGEEFSVILPDRDLDSAIGIAETIRHKLADRKLVKKSTGENIGAITISIGASRYRLGEAIPAFIQRADQALYLAKQSGRNCTKSERDLESDLLVRE